MSVTTLKSGTDLSVRFCGIELKNPLIAASGTFGYGLEFEDVVQLDKLGGFVVKGLSREPITGNPPPRLFETAAGMLNAIGLQNILTGTGMSAPVHFRHRLDNSCPQEAPLFQWFLEFWTGWADWPGPPLHSQMHAFSAIYKSCPSCPNCPNVRNSMQ
jgi:hypothetical protein